MLLSSLTTGLPPDQPARRRGEPHRFGDERLRAGDKRMEYAAQRHTRLRSGGNRPLTPLSERQRGMVSAIRQPYAPAVVPLVTIAAPIVTGPATTVLMRASLIAPSTSTPLPAR